MGESIRMPRFDLIVLDNSHLECFSEKLLSARDSYKPYLEITKARFSDYFLKHSSGVETLTVGELRSAAFASAAIDKKLGRAFLTFVYVPREFRRRGIGSALLSFLEDKLRAKGFQAVDISFFNPINLIWEIPDYPGHVHPNSPGVEKASAAHHFLVQNDYQTYAKQNAYHMNLKQYKTPPEILGLEEQHEVFGITYAIYSKEQMSGFTDLLLDLDNSMWTEQLGSEIAKGGLNRPIIVPLDGNKVIGFTGPLAVEESGRGYFAGVAVHSAYRGKGIAKVLFHKLCSELKALGATYMTLFTGETNPARLMYEKTGFESVKSWDNMRKTL